MVPCREAKSDQHKHPQEAEPCPHREIWGHKNRHNRYPPRMCFLHPKSVFLREGESPNLRYERYCRERDRERVGVLDFLGGGRRRRRRRRRVGR
ncbi:hypothetical protein AMTRI_Chr03g53130 [Amborella trichopoda]